MKANELMIGDWVLISIWDCNPFPSKVTSINYNSYRGKDYVDWIDTEDDEDISMYEVQPIPLTSEILEKNGFEYFHGNCAALGPEDKFSINHVQWPDENGIAVWEYGVIQIRFVHELQHLLRMCHLNKEIEI